MESYNSDISQIHNDGNVYASQRYTAIKPLNESSATGIFSLYRSNRMGKWVVLKALNSEYRNDPFYEAILQKEFQVGYELRHSGIVETIDFVKLPQFGNVIVLEYIDGVTLRDYVNDGGTISRADVEHLVNSICEAVEYIHSHKIIHRDLKPENIMIERATHAIKIIDLGCADASDYNILKGPAGTRHYAAPEQLEQGAVVDVRTDIYAVGKIIDFIIGKTGRPWRKIFNIVQKCCAVNPDDRYASIQELRDALGRKNSRLLFSMLVVSLVVAMVVLTVIVFRSPRAVESVVVGNDSVQVVNDKIDADTEQKAERNNAVIADSLYNSFAKEIRTVGLAKIKNIYHKFEIAEIHNPSDFIEQICCKYLNEACDSLSKYIEGESLNEKIRNLRSVYYEVHFDYIQKSRDRILETRLKNDRQKTPNLEIICEKSDTLSRIKI